MCRAALVFSKGPNSIDYATPKQKFSLEHAYEVSNADGENKMQVALCEFLSTGSRLI